MADPAGIKGLPVPEIAAKLTIATGKNAGKVSITSRRSPSEPVRTDGVEQQGIGEISVLRAVD
ncbi:hypothetical protein [Nonomuraea helvata]|uniref:Uncharacterized protein n=1 Tax=Nonomuraea helvata TaxID=37484 RepID=A0ABV5S3H0_9ACTN